MNQFTSTGQLAVSQTKTPFMELMEDVFMEQDTPRVGLQNQRLLTPLFVSTVGLHGLLELDAIKYRVIFITTIHISFHLIKCSVDRSDIVCLFSSASCSGNCPIVFYSDYRCIISRFN